MTAFRPSKFLLLFCLLLLPAMSGYAFPWLPYGPFGGDARSIAADPKNPAHLYLGTATGWIFASQNMGETWVRLAQVGKRDDLVLDNLIVDPANPKHLLVGAHSLGSIGGGIFISKDGGTTWTENPEMKGQSVRSFALAPSNSKVIVAGTLAGIFRTDNGGEDWRQISPIGSQEIHEVESLAIDPVDTNIIYAGTWHLPWKTTDGGGKWTNIKNGIIDDSDVFSIIVDPNSPKTVYASACSGIYKSDSAGAQFRKVQGIPSTARRTRVLMQSPGNPNIVYAGTTEGLYRTSDAGATWLRTTAPNIIVNDVFVDPSNPDRVLLATDRGGVLTSLDSGMSFVSSNSGFSARQVVSYLQDRTDSRTVYVGVVNDKEQGGIFVSHDDGLTWSQRSLGLQGQDVFSLGQASDGTVIAGTGHGFYSFQAEAWMKIPSHLIRETATAAPIAAKGKKPIARKQPAKPAPRVTASKSSPTDAADFSPSVYEQISADHAIFATTSSGLVRSTDSGLTWKLVKGVPETGLHFLNVTGKTMTAAGLHEAYVSLDAGTTWKKLATPSALTQIGAIAADDQGGLWIGGLEGVYQSKDMGAHWATLKNLFVVDANSITFDATAELMYVTSNSTGTAFVIHFPNEIVTYWDTGWRLRFVRRAGDHIMAATLYDGIVLQPRMVDSPVKQ